MKKGELSDMQGKWDCLGKDCRIISPLPISTPCNNGICKWVFYQLVTAKKNIERVR